MDIENIRNSTEEILKILESQPKYIKNIQAINEIGKRLFEIRMSAPNKYILEKVGKIERNSKILFSDKKHKKYPLVEHFIIEDCEVILSYLQSFH